MEATLELPEVVEQQEIVELSPEVLAMVGGGAIPGMSF